MQRSFLETRSTYNYLIRLLNTVPFFNYISGWGHIAFIYCKQNSVVIQLSSTKSDSRDLQKCKSMPPFSFLIKYIIKYIINVNVEWVFLLKELIFLKRLLISNMKTINSYNLHKQKLFHMFKCIKELCNQDLRITEV